MSVAEILLVVMAMLLSAFVKGASGVGLPLLAVPVMATFLGVEHAVVVMTIPSMLVNAWLMWRYRQHIRSLASFGGLIALGSLGAVLGTFGLAVLNARILAFALVVVIGTYVVLFLRNEPICVSERVAGWLSPPVGLAAGVLQGSIGISGPLLSTYLHALRLPKYSFVLSVATMFGVFSVVQSVTMLQLGLYTGERVTHSLLAMIPMVVAIWLGTRLTDRLSQRAFDRFVLGILVAAAGKLLYDVIVG